jgi:hypothetical protein
MQLAEMVQAMRLDLVATHRSELGAATWPNGVDEGGVCRRRRRGRIRPLRLKIAAKVLIEGSSAPGFARSSAA